MKRECRGGIFIKRGIDKPEQETRAELAKELIYKASASSY
jgi:hypothetical protein